VDFAEVNIVNNSRFRTSFGMTTARLAREGRVREQTADPSPRQKAAGVRDDNFAVARGSHW
jgi:hypothetical protein